MTTVDVVFPAQRTSEDLPAASPNRRLPRTGGRSRPGCDPCMDLKVTLEDSIDTPEEGAAFAAWNDHMNASHPGWRTGPTFPLEAYLEAYSA